MTAGSETELDYDPVLFDPSASMPIVKSACTTGDKPFHGMNELSVI